jgi:hypothetical protein
MKAIRDAYRTIRHPIRSTILSAALAAALATISLVVVASGNPAVAASSLVNGSFETGDLTGWSVDTSASGGDASANGYGVWFCSAAECWYPIYISAKEGSYFAQLTPGKKSEDTVISQPFEASNGDRISGWGFVQADDYYGSTYCDSTGQVVIKSDSGETVATPFSQCAYGVYATWYGAPSGWQNWHYDFKGLTGTGKFRIEARMRSTVDNPAYGAMGLDNVKISTASVDLSPPNITSPQNDTYDTDGSFSVSGSAGAGSTVELFEGFISKGTTRADSSSGAWSIDLSGVPDGTHTYFAKAMDAEGNTSSASNSVTVKVDKTAPKVSEVYPLSGATDVMRNTDIAARFSEEIDPATLTSSAVTLVKDGTTTPIGVKTGLMPSYPVKLWISPWSDDGPIELDANTKYTLKIKGGANGVKDLAGNALEQDYSWSFTTEGAPPTVVGYTPTQTSDVPRSIGPTATFSVNMDPFSIIATNIKFVVYDTKRRKWVSVPHTVSYDATSKTATVSPGSTLAASNQYRVTVTTNVKSRSGVALDQDATTSGNQAKSWTFTTGTS